MNNDYHCPGATVVRNLLEYTEPHPPIQAEALITATRMAKLVANPIGGRFRFAHLQALHRHLLGDHYEWAGELRTIDTTPGDSASRNPGTDLHLHGPARRVEPRPSNRSAVRNPHAGSFPVTINATNGVGNPASLDVTLTVATAPLVDTPARRPARSSRRSSGSTSSGYCAQKNTHYGCRLAGHDRDCRPVAAHCLPFTPHSQWPRSITCPRCPQPLNAAHPTGPYRHQIRTRGLHPAPDRTLA